MFRHFLILSVGLLSDRQCTRRRGTAQKERLPGLPYGGQETRGACAERHRGQIQGRPRCRRHTGEEGARRRFRQLGHGGDGACTRNRERCGSQGGNRLHPYPQVNACRQSKQASFKPACFVYTNNTQTLTSGRASSPHHRPVSSFPCCPAPSSPCPYAGPACVHATSSCRRPLRPW